MLPYSPPGLLDRFFPGDSEMAGRMRAFDWHATGIGVPEQWPEHLRGAVRLCLTSRFPTLLWWGPDLLLLYNDACVPWLGETEHPRAFMRPRHESWSEIWDKLGTMLESVVATGKATWSEDLELSFDRGGLKEEVYLTFTCAPILSADGKRVDGVLNPAIDVTAKVIRARRLETLRRLALRSADAHSVEAACQEAVAALAENQRDIPFAAIYLTDQGGTSARLTASVFPRGGHGLPASVPAAESPWPLMDVLQTRCSAEHDLSTGKAMVVPVPKAQHDLAGLLVVGVSPRRPLDADYRAFFDLVAGQVGNAIADARCHLTERKRIEELAELVSSSRARVGPPADTAGPERTDASKGVELLRLNALTREQELRERLQLQFERIPVACIMFHPQRATITDWNPEAEKIFGYQRSEVLGRHGPEILLGPGSHAVEEQIIDDLRKGDMTDQPQISRNVTKDGRLILCEWLNTPLRNAAGEVVALMSTARDITEREQVQAERERLLQSERLARVEAERAVRIQDDFLAIVSHELRSPLTAIVGWADLIGQAGLTDAEFQHGLEVIRRNVRIQAELIGDLFDLNRIATGKMRLAAELVDLGLAIQAAIEVVKPAADARSIAISCSTEAPHAPVPGDPARLQQIIGNVLSNAVKFTPQGGRIEVKLARTDGYLEVRVKDTGKGILADFLPHVFERFRQADASATREYGGLGIGLALVRELTQLHGGQVSAASDGEGKGATFTVRLPVAATQQEVHAEAATQEEVHAEAAGPPPVMAVAGNEVLEGIRVLLVDDQLDALEVTQRILEDRHARVTALSSADAALSLLAAGASFDVVLCDIGMPGRDGYEFISSMRKLGILTPAAALTALARSEDRTRALYEGFQAHLPKPARALELLVTVRALAGRSRG